MKTGHFNLLATLRIEHAQITHLGGCTSAAGRGHKISPHGLLRLRVDGQRGVADAGEHRQARVLWKTRIGGGELAEDEDRTSRGRNPPEVNAVRAKPCVWARLVRLVVRGHRESIVRYPRRDQGVEAGAANSASGISGFSSILSMTSFCVRSVAALPESIWKANFRPSTLR